MAEVQNAVEQARALLRRHGVVQPPVDVLALAEKEGIRVVMQPLDDQISGLLVQKGNTVVIGVNAQHHPNRQRFTIAHELAHFTLHPHNPTVYVDDMMMHFRGEGTTSAPPQEVEANAFAASLLMPDEFVHQDLAGQTIDVLDDAALRALAQSYQVSQLAFTIRLTELGYLAGSRRE